MSTTDEVCRDFAKGECRRGSSCKYSHTKLEVCRDFQKKTCGREKCRFLHITSEEEEAYENSGELPDHINKEGGNSNRVMNTSYGGGGQALGGMYGKRRRDDTFNLLAGLGLSAIPQAFTEKNETFADQLCRDFDKGKCTRGNSCRYYHPKLKICRDFQNNKCERETCRFLHITRDEEASYENSGILPDHIDEEKAKKSRVMNGQSGRGAENIGGMYGKRSRSDSFDLVSGLSALPKAVMQDNLSLKLKVKELQQHVMDLHKMNDTLFEQNNTYRNKYRGATGVV